MKNLLNPKWLLIINTLPVLLLTCLLSAQYSIIKSMLSEANIHACIIFVSALALLSISTLLYSIIQLVRKQPLSIYYGLLSLIFHMLFLYIYYNHLSRMIPMNIPLWLLGDDIIIYIGTFLMPTMAHAVLIIVMGLTPDDKKHTPGLNFLAALAIPVSWYLFAQLVLPFWQKIDGDFSFHIIIVLIIASTVIFLFLLIRTFYIITVQKTAFFVKHPLVWKIPLAIVFPILGLLINGGCLNQKDFWNSTHSIFGNFNSIWFYIFALLNGIALCLPDSSNHRYRLILFCGRSILLAYTFYFFLVFLPYLPLSVLLILLFGAGFLMLTPLVLFIVHIQQLSADITYLKQFFSNKVLYPISIAGFTVLPFLIIADDIRDRNILHEALNYVYTPDYSKTNRIDETSLQKTLHILKHHKDRNDWFQRESQTPYLSTLFNWIVLDNMTLSDYKIQTLEKIFLGHSSSLRFVSNQFSTSEAVKLTDIETRSSFNEETNTWVSTLDLEFTNTSKDNWQEEYATSFQLPEGCWISDYYLYVGDKKKQGLLVEKKAALWTYSQIVNTRRDPGILYHLTGNSIAFRVFPFAKNEIRKTGIEFIHSEPVDLIINNKKVHLGNDRTQNQKPNFNINNQVFFVSSEEKESLRIVQRTPYYHFIVDLSKGKEDSKQAYTTQIENLLAQNELPSQHAKISFTNSVTQTHVLDSTWKAKLAEHTCEGGFYLEHAIKSILTDAYRHPSATYPVIVVVADSLSEAILEKDFASLKFTMPENHQFYCLYSNGTMEPHSLLENPLNVSADSTALVFDNKVLAWPNEKKVVAYLPNDSQPSIVIKGIVQPHEQIVQWREKNYQAALYMQAEYMSQLLYPYTSEEQWIDLVKQSFKTKILSPYTSYMVVETEAQKAMLLKKQRQTLAGNKSLDLQEDPQRMTEPEFIVVALLFGIYLSFKYRKKLFLRLP